VRKLNVLQFICPVGFYGAERWILALANNLNPTIVRCDIVVTQESADQKPEITSHYPGKAGQIFSIKMTGRFDFSVIGKLCEVIRQRQIHIIHTHGYKSDILGLIAAKKTGIKCVSTPHGFGQNIDLKLRSFIKLGCYALRHFNRVAPLSIQIYQDLVDMGVPAKKLAYIQNGVDLSELDDFIKLKNIPQNPITSGKHIGFVGQMIPRKGINEMLMIFNQLWQEDNTLTLSLLGDGEQLPELERFAKTLSSADHIKFLGFRLDRLEMMSTFDLFVMTSTLEGIPRCLMEAMAMELPVAAYDIPGIDQLVEHGKTGLLAKPGDRASLVAHWTTLLYDESYAQQLAVKGRQFVQEKYSAARMANEYIDLFHRLLSTEPQKG